MAWWRDMGFFEVRIDELENPSMQFAAQPQVYGTNVGRTVSLQSQAREGTTLFGRALDVNGCILELGGDLKECKVFV